jgi:hypothetical protein
MQSNSEMIPSNATIGSQGHTTTSEWFSWLQQEAAKMAAVYRSKPTLLIADYHRERDTTRDYEGREILELLQNANDQAAESGVRGHVLIELAPDGLIVANTGAPFSIAGIESLQISHLSPKRRRRRQVIGSKGLGFRSVLNWSRTPIILSGSLRIAYSVSHAREVLNSLVSDIPELMGLVHEEQQGRDQLILPMLSFPFSAEDGDLSSHLLDDQARGLLARCQQMLDDGYDTAIGMPFDQPKSHGAVIAQIDQLRPEILLFVRNIKELQFRNQGQTGFIWRLDPEAPDGLVSVLSNDKPLGSWQVYHKSEKLPEAERDADQLEDTDYEIVIAVPAIGSNTSSPLFSFFPTDIRVPLSVVCHATLVLEQNRKHFQEGHKGNEYVLGQLAIFLAEIAEQTAATSTDDPWAGCSLVMPIGEFPDELSRAGFPKRLTEASQIRALVPR